VSQIAGDSVAGQSMASEATTKVTKALLACGVIAGPLFMVVSLVQAFTRPGFDLKRHAISMLSLGDLGWIQVTNFELTGLLAIALAVVIVCAILNIMGVKVVSTTSPQTSQIKKTIGSWAA